jgi:hypothetical protein
VAVTKSDPDIQTFAPSWPALESLPMEQIRLTYDRPSNTLFVDFFGRALPAASIPVELGDRDYYYLRVDVETDEVVGLQIESFLTYALAQHPGLADVLAFAELVGTDRGSPTEIERLAAGVNPNHRDRAAVIQELVRLGMDHRQNGSPITEPIPARGQSPSPNEAVSRR